MRCVWFPLQKKLNVEWAFSKTRRHLYFIFRENCNFSPVFEVCRPLAYKKL